MFLFVRENRLSLSGGKPSVSTCKENKILELLFKVLTLASNERIAMTKSMRLLFEISNLRTATPATVSRAGILYINPTDLGWNP